MELKKYIDLLERANADNEVCKIGKTTVFQFGECIVVSSNEMRHFAVLDYEITIIVSAQVMKSPEKA